MSCAQSSTVDVATNALSLFHVLDEISAPTFPLQLASFCVAAMFERREGDDAVQNYVLSITLDSELLASFTMQVNFAESFRNRSVNTIKNLAIPAPGRLGISLLQKDTVMATWETVAIQTRLPAPVVSAPLAPNEFRPNAPKAGPLVN